ncbi:MAG TPA: DUF2607 family protein [Acidiferrobacterales bacterium]
MNTGEKNQTRNKASGIAWLLAALLVLGQWAALAHKLDLASHESGHVCEWCVAHAGLDHLIAGAAAAIPTLATTDLSPVGDASGIPASFVAHYPARAPPAPRSI